MSYKKKFDAGRANGLKDYMDDLKQFIKKELSTTSKPVKKSSQLESSLIKCMDNENFFNVIDSFFSEQYEKGKIPYVILATYNRVGDGSLEGEIKKPNFTINILNGASHEKPGEGTIDKFLEEKKEKIEKDMFHYGDNAPMIIFYGGSAENFSKVGKTIDQLDASSKLLNLKEDKKPKFFLLSCNCQREEKIKSVLPLIKDNRLKGFICESSGSHKTEKKRRMRWF